MDDAQRGVAAMRPGPAPVRRGGLGAWWRQGLRAALFMRPDWAGLQATPILMALLVLSVQGVAIGLERVFVEGGAQIFYGPSLMAFATLLVAWAWACWLGVSSTGASVGPPKAGGAPDAPALLSMLMGQALFTTLVGGLVLWPMTDGGFDIGLTWEEGRTGVFAVGMILWAWTLLAQLILFWRGATARSRAKVFGCVVLALAAALPLAEGNYFLHWYPDVAEDEARAPGEAGDDDTDRFELTQDRIEAQAALLAERLGALQPQRRKAIDVYAITFAPYAEGDVFRRESAMVASVMQQRFDADGRVIQLVNHRDAAREWPWATPLNLQRAIRRTAELMDHEQDVLFIHMTSHGAQSGELAASFRPLEVDPVTPQDLKAWLDEAGIRHRILSISACYSGSWIAPLSDPDTLVMTAADADHTSYGCGRRSELTFFGRAMYDEQMRQTLSFEAAHAEARKVIEQREKEAGKTDGYSNPQIAMGDRMRAHLARLETQLTSLTHVKK